MSTVNERGQIVGESGTTWLREVTGFWSVSPRGYFIERVGPRRYELFRKEKSSLPTRDQPFVRRVIGRGSWRDCARLAELHQVLSSYDVKLPARGR